jgi:hypothetical protein
VSDWVCGNCKSINRGSANSCYSCGGAREVVAATPSRPFSPAAAADGAGVATMHLAASNAGALIGDAAAGTPAVQAPPPPAQASRGPAGAMHLVGGILAGSIAAVVASAVWYGVVVVTNYQVGIVAIAVGFIVGQAVALGAGRRGHIVLVAASVLLTLFALATSEYLIVVHFVEQAMVADGAAVTFVGLAAQPPDFILEVIVESIKSDPLTLVFWAIALFQAFVIPARLLGRRGA